MTDWLKHLVTWGRDILKQRQLMSTWLTLTCRAINDVTKHKFTPVPQTNRLLNHLLIPSVVVYLYSGAGVDTKSPQLRIPSQQQGFSLSCWLISITAICRCCSRQSATLVLSSAFRFCFFFCFFFNVDSPRWWFTGGNHTYLSVTAWVSVEPLLSCWFTVSSQPRPIRQSSLSGRLFFFPTHVSFVCRFLRHIGRWTFGWPDAHGLSLDPDARARSQKGDDARCRSCADTSVLSCSRALALTCVRVLLNYQPVSNFFTE